MMGTWEEGQKEKRMGRHMGEEDKWADEGRGQVGRQGNRTGRRRG